MRSSALKTVVMNLTDTKKKLGAFAALMVLPAAFLDYLLARIEAWIPIGYEDDAGFHFGVEKSQKR